jgi:hypothetical protein
MLLKAGDVIELKKGHTVYATIPEHFAYSNKVGCFNLCDTEVPVGGEKNGLNTDYLLGKWIVTSTASEGGGTGHGCNDVYPDGHRVTCMQIKRQFGDFQPRVSFYQTGSFTAMIKEGEIKAIGRATATYKIEEDTSDSLTSL